MAWKVINGASIPIGFLDEVIEPGAQYSKLIPKLNSRMLELSLLGILICSGADDIDAAEISTRLTALEANPVVSGATLTEVDARKYGAKLDGWHITQATIDSSDLTKVVLNWAGSTDRPQASAVTLGNGLLLRRSGAGGVADLWTTITAVTKVGTFPNDVWTLTMANAAYAATTNAAGWFGTDDAPSINIGLLANGHGNFRRTNAWGPTIEPYGGSGANAALPRIGTEGGLANKGSRLVLRGSGRNGTMCCIASPIRLVSGCELAWDGAVLVALPNFAGEAMIYQIVNDSNLPQVVVSSCLTNPLIYAGGQADIGLWTANSISCRIDGGLRVHGARIMGFKVGPDSNPNAERVITYKVNGAVEIVNDAGFVGTLYQNDPNSLGFEFTAFATDNVVDGKIEVVAYRKGFKDRGGNNVCSSEIHLWTAKNMGYMTIGADIQGVNFHYGRIFVDSPWADAGTPIIGVKFSGNASGRVDDISSTINPSVGTLDNTVTLISYQAQTTYGAVNVGSVHSTSTAGIKFKAVVDQSLGAAGGLVIDSTPTGDGLWYTLGYTSPVATLADAVTANSAYVQGQLDGINTLLPGSAWTPKQLSASRIPLWLDASLPSSLTTNANLVQQWASRSGSAKAASANGINGTVSTLPTFSPTGFDGTRPAVIFNGLPSGDMLDLGGDATIVGSDVTVFMALKRGVQDTTDTAARRTIAYLNDYNAGVNSFAGQVQFYNATQDASQNKVRVQSAGGGSLDVTSLVAADRGIVTAYFAPTWTPPNATAVEQINMQLHKAGTKTQTSTPVAIQHNTPSTYANVRSFLGGQSNSLVDRAAFALAEMIVVTGIMSVTEIEQIRGYLAAKWWPTPASVLDATATYQNSAPTIAPALTSAIVNKAAGLADKAVVNTTAATSLVPASVQGSVSLAANTLSPGKTHRVTMTGIYSTQATPGNLTIAVKLGSVTLASATISNLEASAGNAHWKLELDIVCRTAGVTGTVQTGGVIRFETAAGVLGYAPLNNSGASATVDTTLLAAIDITAAWATASASNSITTKTLSLEAVN